MSNVKDMPAVCPVFGCVVEIPHLHRAGDVDAYSIKFDADLREALDWAFMKPRPSWLLRPFVESMIKQAREHEATRFLRDTPPDEVRVPREETMSPDVKPGQSWKGILR